MCSGLWVLCSTAQDTYLSGMYVTSHAYRIVLIPEDLFMECNKRPKHFPKPCSNRFSIIVTQGSAALSAAAGPSPLPVGGDVPLFFVLLPPPLPHGPLCCQPPCLLSPQETEGTTFWQQQPACPGWLAPEPVTQLPTQGSQENELHHRSLSLVSPSGRAGWFQSGHRIHQGSLQLSAGPGVRVYEEWEQIEIRSVGHHLEIMNTITRKFNLLFIVV